MMKKLTYLLLLLGSLMAFNACAPEDDDPIPMPMPEPEPEKDPDILDLPASGLQVYLDFNENVDDHSGNDFHGIINGGEYIADRDTAEEGALALAHGDYILLNQEDQLGFGSAAPYSIGGFIRFRREAGNMDSRMHIISKFNGGVLAGWYLAISAQNQLQAYRNVVPWSMSTAAVLQEETWYHLMVTFDGSNHTLWVDGQIAATEVWTTHPNDTQTPIMIGGVHSNHVISPSFSGDVDDIVIYDRALTPTEINNMVED